MTPVLEPGAYEWVATGREFFTRLLRSINESRVSIRLEVYILTPDAIGRAVASALTLAALRGVDVRVLLDGLGSSAILQGFWDDLSRAGGQIRWFNASEFRRLPIRNHRKLVVVDGRVAGVGASTLRKNIRVMGWSRGGRTLDWLWLARRCRRWPGTLTGCGLWLRRGLGGETC